MKKVITTLLLVTGLSATTVFSQKLNTPKLDSFFRAVSDNNKAMASMAISKNGKIIYANTIGYSLITDKKRIKSGENTVYHIGSVTKLFTATMIFQLIEEGRISLNTNISGYFPSIPGSKNITIEMLLAHRSGLFDYVNDVEDPKWRLQPHTRETILDTIANGKTHFPPNASTSYCNSGYFLLAIIIEKITNRTYNENLQERICKKAGLAKTFVPAAGEFIANEAKPYAYILNRWKETREIYFPNALGAGDILSTPKELIAFEEALLYGKLVTSKSVQLMIGNIDSSYGLGMEKVPFKEKMSYGHSGDTRGNHSIAFHFPGDSLTIAACMNGEALPHGDFFVAILNICFNQPYDIPSFKTYKVSMSVLKNYTGVYSCAELPFKITVSQKNGILYAQAPEQAPFPLEAASDGHFSYLPAKITLSFDAVKHQATMHQYDKSYLLSKEK